MPQGCYVTSYFFSVVYKGLKSVLIHIVQKFVSLLPEILELITITDSDLKHTSVSQWPSLQNPNSKLRLEKKCTI